MQYEAMWIYLKNKFKLIVILTLFLRKECLEGSDHQELVGEVYLASFLCLWLLEEKISLGILSQSWGSVLDKVSQQETL